MGVDIHMYVVKNKKIIKSDMFKGRNSEWFGNMQGEGWEEEYDHLPFKTYGVSEQAPDELIKKAKRDYYYGYRTIIVKDFKKWFEKYRPDLHASWVNTYDHWRYLKKNIYPKDNEKHYLDPEDVKEDWLFIEWEDEYDCSRWLYNELKNIDDDAELTYWFDC